MGMKSDKHVVAVLLLPGVVAFDLAIPGQVFGQDPAGRYEVGYAAVAPGPVSSNLGLDIMVEHGLELLELADTVIVPAYAPAPVPPRVLGALQRAAARGARVASICAGAFALAEAGLLDGRTATTHWMHAAELARRYPAVTVDDSVLFVDDGDVLTSAGLAAGLDLCLHMVQRDCGEAAAVDTARRMVMPLARAGGQAQFIPKRDIAGAGAVAEVSRWLDTVLAEPVTVAAMATRANCSQRTLNRAFKDAYGLSPQGWLMQRRLQRACRLLEDRELTIDAVARHAGLGTPTNLRLHFRKHLATTPTAFRAAFAA